MNDAIDHGTDLAREWVNTADEWLADYGQRRRGPVVSADVYIVSATGYGGVDRVCDRLQTAQRVCDDFLNKLRKRGAVIETWTDLSAKRDGSLVVRYWQDGSEIREQRLERRRVDTVGSWYPESVPQ